MKATNDCKKAPKQAGGSGSSRKRSFFMEAEAEAVKTESMVAEAETVETKSIGVEAEAEAVSKPGSGSRSGSSWLLISGSGSG